MAWIDAQLPNWLAARAVEKDQTPAVMAALKFGADLQQRNLDNAFRLKQFEAQEQSRNLQNQLLQTKLDNDAADASALAEWLPKFSNTTGDELRSIELPALRDVNRLEGVQMMITRRIAAEAGTTSQRIMAETLNYNMKELSALDPDLRQLAMPYLQQNGLFDPEGIETFRFAKDEQQRRDQELKLSTAEAQQKMIESRQVAVEKVKNLYRAGLRGATSITDKAKLSAFNNELHQITFDPLLSTEEKESKQRDVLSKYGVSPSFQEGEAAPTAFEGEESIYDQEIANVQREIDQKRVDLAKNPKKALTDFGRDNRLIKIDELEQQKTALQNAKKGQPAPAPAADRVRVRSKDGKIGTVPRSQLEQAKKEGYSLVE